MPRWMGRCPECDAFGTVVEEPVAGNGHGEARQVATEPLSAFDPDLSQRVATGVAEFDRVLGGGLVPAGVVLLAGEPGVGKSTLSLQVATSIGADREVLMVCGEEAPQQVRARAARMGDIPPGVHTLADPDIGSVLGAISTSGASVAVIDSIQTVFDPDIPSAPGSVSQVRECGARLARAARETGVTVVLVGHVTKEGTVAGPRVLEHLVDVVLSFDGDRTSGVRVLRPLKNRFGSTQEVGFFEMRSEGLVAIRDASAYLLADRSGGLAGSVLAGCVEGRRPFVCEVQALVTASDFATPRRSAIGVDASRLPMLLAVLDARAGLDQLKKCDVYVSAVGGLRVTEPALDLPIALAVMSATTGEPVPEEAVAFGEIGLSGEVRQVVASDRRMAEAANVSCKIAYVPRGYSGDDAGLDLRRIRHVRVALEAIGKRW